MLTLKEKYERKALTEKLKKIDNDLLIESMTSHILAEALDEEYGKVTEVIAKLGMLKGKGLNSLDTAIQAATDDVNKWGQKGGLGKGIAAIAGIMKGKLQNPIVGALTLVNALENGFRVLPQVIKNNVDVNILDKSATGALSDMCQKKDSSGGVQKTLTDTLIKAFTPSGTFAGVFKKVPYLGEVKILVAEMLEVDVKTLRIAYATLNKGTSTKEASGAVEKTKKQKNSDVPGLTGKEIKQMLKKVQPELTKLGIEPGGQETLIKTLLNLGVLKAPSK